MEHLNTVSNGGKTNVNGNLVYTTAIPHRNPVLCVIFARGLMLLYRWLCMGEPFPDLLEYKEYFKVHALRSESSQYVTLYLLETLILQAIQKWLPSLARPVVAS